MSRSRRSFLQTCCVLPAVGLFSGRAAAEEIRGAKSAAIDQLVAEVLDEGGPGLAMFVAHRGKVVHRRAYGLANLKTERTLTTRTPFDLASVSKQFTAMAIMILAERGRLTLRDDIRKYLPEMPAFDEERPIRILDLLHHTSGLTDYMDLWTGSDEEFETLPNSGVLKIVAKSKLGHETGTEYEYSNTNYALLPIIVERSTRMSFAKFQAQEIFKPLEMHDSLVYDGTAPLPKSIARGYKRNDDGKFEIASSPSVIVGDGNQFSSLEDLEKWDSALRAHRLVSKPMQDRAFAAGKLDDGEFHSYGFGWVEGDDEAHPSVSHDGSWAGTATYICRYLQDDATVAILANDEGLDVAELGESVAEIFR